MFQIAMQTEEILATPHDLNKARSTYEGLIGLLKWGTVASVAIAALVIVLLAG